MKTNFPVRRGLLAVSLSIALSPGALAAPAGAEAPPAAGATAQDMKAREVDADIDCFNATAKPAYDVLKRYAAWVGENGPTGKEKKVDGLGHLNPAPRLACEKQLSQVGDPVSELADLRAAMATYLRALSALTTRINEADAYYARKGYQQDRFAKAKALHGPLTKGFETFVDAQLAFRNEIETENEPGYRLGVAGIQADTQAPVLGELLKFFQLESPRMSEWMLQSDFAAEDHYKLGRMAKELGRCRQIVEDGDAYDAAHAESLTPAQARAHVQWVAVRPAMDAVIAAAAERLREIQALAPAVVAAEASASASSPKAPSGDAVDPRTRYAGASLKLVDAYEAYRQENARFQNDGDDGLGKDARKPGDKDAEKGADKTAVDKAVADGTGIRPATDKP